MSAFSNVQLIILSGLHLQHVLSLRYFSGMGCISSLDMLTQTLDIKDDRMDIRFNVIQTKPLSFYFALMSVAARNKITAEIC